MNKKEIKTLSKPWITPAIQKSIVIKNFYFRKSLKSNNPTFYCKFKRYRNKLNHLIKISKKGTITTLSVPLEEIFNNYLTYGLIPDCIKIAKVIPMYKKGTQDTLNNYRPISLLPIFNKLLEKLVFKRLMNFLNKFDILYDKQFGFRPRH